MNRDSSLPSPRFARAKDLPFRHLDGQTVIVDPQRREVHVLNGTASTIWDLLGEEDHTVWDLVAALGHDASFDVPLQIIAADLDGFLSDLVQKGLVQTTTPAPGR
ncbi:MAG TPA: PqqD family protein [Polyangia bacterium]